jgi:hypothetical protein
MPNTDAFAATIDPRQAPAGDALAARPGDALAARPADPLDADYRQNIADQRRMMEEQTRTAQEREKALGPMRQEQLKQLRQPLPQPPQPQQLPAAPKRNEPGADESWLMVAGVLGAIAGGLTRNHTTNALAAMTGAMEGYNEGSRQKFDQNVKIWDAETKRILETNQQANEQYKQILESRKLAFQQKMEELQLVAAKYDDRATMQLAQQGNAQKIGDMIEKRMQLAGQMSHYDQQLRMQYAKFTQQEKMQAEKLQAQRDIAAMKRGVGGDNPLSDATVNFMAEQYLAGDTSVFTNLGRGAQGAENIIRLRNKIAELSGERGTGGAAQAVKNAEYQGLKAGERTLAVRESNIGTAIIEANKFASLAQAASDKLPRGSFVPWNQLQQMGQAAMSNPDLAQFKAYTNSLLQAYTRAVQGSGTVTVDARRHADEMISTAMSPQAYRAVIQALQSEMRAALEAPRELREMMRQHELSFVGQDFSQDRSPSSPAGAASPSAGKQDLTAKDGRKWSVEAVQ